MFIVDENSKKITLHRGDTGCITITLKGYSFSNVNAVALFTMKVNGNPVKEEVHQIDDNNQFVVEFKNPDTDGMGSVTGEYDVRVVIDPVFDANGVITDGDFVRTPNDPIPVEIRRTVGTV